MANQGAKKRREENTRHMRNLLRLILASNAIYLVIRLGIFHSSFTWKHWAGLILTSLAYVIPYKQLSSMAEPSYSDDGELLDGGFDMSTGGICGYLDSLHINSLDLSKGFCRMVQTERRKMRRHEKREKRWGGRLQEPKWSRRGLDD
ncbi:transmembrane 208 homolog [Olea europaea subsp. europaea]|uniref:Transmembrane 208 homolog n=2 Tax=Olea europaea subsp. europaea TaxID=158383 RepID=A0A8S0SUZ2_OLEEU|nr:transmembrane 208 homolog [Olea europaea subsp. europaea]